MKRSKRWNDVKLFLFFVAAIIVGSTFIKQLDRSWYRYRCPKCSSDINWRFTICFACGQRVKWVPRRNTPFVDRSED